MVVGWTRYALSAEYAILLAAPLISPAHRRATPFSSRNFASVAAFGLFTARLTSLSKGTLVGTDAFLLYS